MWKWNPFVFYAIWLSLCRSHKDLALVYKRSSGETHLFIFFTKWYFCYMIVGFVKRGGLEWQAAKVPQRWTWKLKPQVRKQLKLITTKLLTRVSLRKKLSSLEMAKSTLKNFTFEGKKKSLQLLIVDTLDVTKKYYN